MDAKHPNKRKGISRCYFIMHFISRGKCGVQCLQSRAQSTHGCWGIGCLPASWKVSEGNREGRVEVFTVAGSLAA